MSVRLVNTVPGSLDEPQKPGDAVHFGAKSEAASIDLGTLRVTMGLSGIVLGAVVPESDTQLERKGATVVLTTSERRNPVVGAVTTSMVSNQLRLSKTDNSDNNNCVYEISVPIEPGASVMGYFKLRKNSSWTLFSPDWCNQTLMSGVYLGLEHGGFNTACYAFFRNAAADGSLVIGGPLPSFGAARPGQVEYAAFDWAALSNDTVIEVWLLFNVLGHPSPFSPALVPVVEIWTKRAGVDTVPVVHGKIPVGNFGTFPASGINNSRPGVSQVARLFLGLPGRTGDLLKVDDFTLFPDYRVAVSGGTPMPRNGLSVLPDAPVAYHVRDGRKPEDSVPGRWLPLSIRPSSALKFRSDSSRVARHLMITKDVSGPMAYVKAETRVEADAPVSSVNGAMIEAFMSGSFEEAIGELFGAGLSIDDGVQLFRLAMLVGDERYTYGLLSDDSQHSSIDNGYYVPEVDVDHRTMKLMRLTVDRQRDKVTVHVDEEKVIEETLSTGTFPVTEGEGGRFAFGHLFDEDTKGRHDVKFVNYLPRYSAFEATDGDLPTASTPAFTAQIASDGSGSSVAGAEVLTIKKVSVNTSGSKRYFKKAEDVQDAGGFLVDFKAKVISFTDAVGRQFYPLSSTGAGVTVFLGNKKLELFFVNCGLLGKYLGVVPGSGSIDDIINQTELGKQFSAEASWDEGIRFRLVYRAFSAIEVWAGSVSGDPIITIPWRNDTDGFDLPADVTAAAVAFGHFDPLTSSTVEWDYFRWGASNGYEIAVQPEYEEKPSSLFGGRSFVVVDIEE